MKIAKHFILQLHAGYHILAYEVLISGRVSEIRGLGVGTTECAAVGILPRWFKGVCSLASACFIAPFVLIIQQRRHYGAYLVAATDRTQGETGENANDPEGEGHARKSCSVRRTEQEGDNYAEVFRVYYYCLSKAFFSTFKEETTSCT